MKVENDLLGRLLVCFQKQIERFDFRPIPGSASAPRCQLVG
jgi:hypothetical protein